MASCTIAVARIECIPFSKALNGFAGVPPGRMRRSRVMWRWLARSANSQLVHRAIPRVLKPQFLSVETINLWLQCKVSPGMQLVHPLDFESIQLSLDYVQFLC